MDIVDRLEESIEEIGKNGKRDQQTITNALIRMTEAMYEIVELRDLLGIKKETGQ